MYLSDLEKDFLITQWISVIDTCKLHVCPLLNIDYIILFGETPEDLQNALNVLEDYCQRRKRTVNTRKTVIMT